MAPRLFSTRLAQPYHRKSEARRRGDGGKDREDYNYRYHEAHKQQVEEVMETLAEGPEGFYASPSE